MASTVCLNPEVMRDLIDRIFKDGTSVKTLLCFAFSGKPAFDALSSALKKRLCVKFALDGIYFITTFALSNNYYQKAVFSIFSSLALRKHELCFLSRFVDSITTSRITYLDADFRQIISLFKNCTKFSTELTNLEVCTLLPNLTELKFEACVEDKLDDYVLVGLFPNIKNVCIKFMKNEWQSPPPNIMAVQTFLTSTSSILHAFPSLEKVDITYDIVSQNVVEDIDGVKQLFESTNFTVNLNLNVYQHFYRRDKNLPNVLNARGFNEVEHKYGNRYFRRCTSLLNKDLVQHVFIPDGLRKKRTRVNEQ